MAKLGRIQESPLHEKTPFRKGDSVESQDLGNGVVVGFSSISGEPHVFFYSVQTVLCVGAETLTRN